MSRTIGAAGAASLLLLLAACAHGADPQPQRGAQVLFVCEHGNVKSLMAASYFNRLAADRGLEARAISRGVAPDSTTVPTGIAAALRSDGFDVTDFHPEKVTPGDVTLAQRVVTIGTDLPAAFQVHGAAVQKWNDVPPASTNYPAARDALVRHVAKLIDEMQAGL